MKNKDDTSPTVSAPTPCFLYHLPTLNFTHTHMRAHTRNYTVYMQLKTPIYLCVLMTLTIYTRATVTTVKTQNVSIMSESLLFPLSLQ